MRIRNEPQQEGRTRVRQASGEGYGRTYYFKNGVAKFLHKTLNRGAKADANWASHKS